MEGHTVLVNRRAEILIKANPEQIWDFANDSEHWRASNPDEHYGTEFFTPDKKVMTGGRFHQRESVAGVRADMKGHFLHVDRPNNVSWTAVAEYRLLRGLIRFRVPQSGILKLEPGEDGVTVSHDMFVDIPDTWRGKLVARYLKKSRKLEKRIYEHGQKELVYLKNEVERLSGESRVARGDGAESSVHMP
jgi:hypothetical protein